MNEPTKVAIDWVARAWRVARGHPTYLVSGVFCWVWAFHIVHPSRFPTLSARMLAAGVLLLASLAVGVRLLMHLRRPDRTPAGDLESGVLTISVTGALVQVLGGVGSVAYPLLYLVASLIAGLTSARIGSILVLLAAIVEGVSALFFGRSLAHLVQLAEHLGLMWLFVLVLGYFLEGHQRTKRISNTMLEEVRAKSAAADRHTSGRIGESPRGSFEPAADPEPIVAPETGAFDLDSVFFDLLRVLQQAVGARAAVFCVLDSSGRNVVVRQSVSEGIDLARSVDLDALGWPADALRLGQWISRDDLKAKSFALYSDGLAPRSMIATPVTVSGRSIGLLLVDSLTPGAFSRGEGRLATATAALMGDLIARGSQFDAMLAEAAVVRRLPDRIVELVRAGDDPVRALVRQCREATGCHAALAAMDTGDGLIVVAAKGIDVEGRRVDSAETIAGDVFTGGRTFFEPRFREWERDVDRAGRRPLFGKSVKVKDVDGVVVAPIAFSGRRVLGVVACLSRNGSPMNSEARAAVEILAATAARLLAPEPEPEAVEPTPENQGDRVAERLAYAESEGASPAVLLVEASGDADAPWDERVVAAGVESVHAGRTDSGAAVLVVADGSDDSIRDLFARLVAAAEPAEVRGGAARFPEDGRTSNELIARAEQALQAARDDSPGSLYTRSGGSLQSL